MMRPVSVLFRNEARADMRDGDADRHRWEKLKRHLTLVPQRNVTEIFGRPVNVPAHKARPRRCPYCRPLLCVEYQVLA